MLTILALASVFVVACVPAFDIDRGGIAVYNETDRTLDISYVEGASERRVYQGLDPGKWVPIGGGFLAQANNYCTTGTLLARDAAGTEVARWPAPICYDDRWVITIPSPSPT